MEPTHERLADEDNENDEYHAPVPLPDVWAEYKRLHEGEGWTQQQIAQAKGVTQSSVSVYLRFAAFPKPVLNAFIKHAVLKEEHARELLKLSKFDNFAPWLTPAEQRVTVTLCPPTSAMADRHPVPSRVAKQRCHCDTFVFERTSG